jgi:hypothetical protein
MISSSLRGFSVSNIVVIPSVASRSGALARTVVRLNASLRLLLLLGRLREEKLLEPFRPAAGGSVSRSTKEGLLYDRAVTAAYSLVISHRPLEI